MPQTPRLDALVRDIAERMAAAEERGRVATYIPELACIDPARFGISVCLADGRRISAGDATRPFSIQSVSKVFALAVALGRIGDATVAQQLLPYLDRELRVRAEVAGAMARFSYQDSVSLIAKALPEPNAVEDGEAYHVYAMLRALHELGAEETSRLARTYLEIPAMRHVRNLLEPFLGNEDRGGQEAAKGPAWKNK